MRKYITKLIIYTVSTLTSLGGLHYLDYRHNEEINKLEQRLERPILLPDHLNAS